MAAAQSRTWLILPLLVLCFVSLGHSLANAQGSSEQEKWTQFRGTNAQGISSNNRLPLEWSTEKNVAWKSEISGRGWSSPVVWGNRVFLTSVESDTEIDDDVKGLYFGGERSEPPEGNHRWAVICLDLESGEELWKTYVHEGRPPSSIHIKNSFASETPVTDGKRVYCYFGNMGLYALDFEGEVVWEREMEPKKTRFGWGLAASPALHNDRLYIVNDNEEASYLAAIETATGDTVWQIDRDEKSNWSTPFIWEYEGRTEIVTPGTGTTRSYSLDGELLWSFQGMSLITIATPYPYDEWLIISSGYLLDPRKPIYAVKKNATGDLTLEEEEDSNSGIAWRIARAAPYNPTTLIYKDNLFVLLDRGLYEVYDARDGSLLHEKRRTEGSRAYTSSPWAYRDHVFAIDEDGTTTVFDAKNGFNAVGTCQLADDDLCLATPAMVGDRLLIRTAKRIYCFREQADK